MTHDLVTLRAWIRIVVIICAICTTSVPLTYSFSAWRSRTIGKLFMLQAISFAAAIDMTLLFTYWTPQNILMLFWIDAIVLTAIAMSTAALAVLMLKLNFSVKKKRHIDED